MLKGYTAVLEDIDFSPDPCIYLCFDFFLMVYYVFFIFFILSLFKAQKIQVV